ncbi:MAG: glycosyltransferase [Nitrososphaera sp.]|nr:glycosyltransferase [Nitrososphaera sp.]
MDKNIAKAKLIFFQYRYREDLPEFLLLLAQHHVKCLQQHFELTVINYHCDYQKICDTYQPDMALFETGLNLLVRACQKPKITNIRACSEIPKLALINADAWCETRAGTLSEMEHWGIETCFSISMTAAEHTPEIADHLFIWPNFIDPEIYRDYGESKIIPVFLTGAKSTQYPWRQRIHKLLSEHYPSLSSPHQGYLVRSSAGQLMYGEQYARMINASWCVPTCGTIAKEVVRKHFEIPGCRACLITERTQALEAAGFVDMINCVFADVCDILDKVDYLFRNPEHLERIANAGYQLVHACHTHKQRDQILQWLNLHQHLRSTQRIVQLNPFDPLTVVEKSSGITSSHISCDGFHLLLLRLGDEKLWTGKYTEAESFYLRCLNFMRGLPEAKLRLALCSLYKGDARMAVRRVLELIRYTLFDYKALDPEPVEWAYYVISLLCLGKLEMASKHASQFPWLQHPELARTRWVIKALKNRGKAAPVQDVCDLTQRSSIHKLPRRSSLEWMIQLYTMLKACGQWKLAEIYTRN